MCKNKNVQGIRKNTDLKIIEIYFLSDISRKLVFMYSFPGSFTRL